MDKSYLHKWGFRVEDYRRSFKQLQLSDLQVKTLEEYIASFPSSGGLVLVGSPKIAQAVSTRIVYELYELEKFKNRVTIIDVPSFLVRSNSFSTESTEVENKTREDITNADLVILQEVDLAQWTSIQQTKLYTLIYERYSKRQPMIFTATSTPSDIEKRVGMSTFYRIKDLCKFLALGG